MTNFNFNSRETYKAWVKEWKTTYEENSQIIRNLKRDMKDQMRSGADSSTAQRRREYYRNVQREALAARADAKVEAQRQWTEARATAEAA